MEKNKKREEDFRFFAVQGRVKIILTVITALISEIGIVYYYFLIDKEENILRAFETHAQAMIILPVLPLYFMMLGISKFKRDIKVRKDILKSGCNEYNNGRLYYCGNINGKKDHKFGDILFKVRKRCFFNYFFLLNLLIPVFLFLIFGLGDINSVLKALLSVVSLILTLNIIINLLSVIEFYEYGIIIYNIISKKRIEYIDIFNFTSEFQDNKSYSRLKIGTDSTVINIDTIKYAVTFSVSTSRYNDKIHKEISEFSIKMKELMNRK